MTFDKFLKLCRECWNVDEHVFLVIDKDSKMNEVDIEVVLIPLLLSKKHQY